MILRLIALIALMATPALAQEETVRPPSSLGLALQAASTGRWTDADEIAARDGTAAQAVIEYMSLYAGRGTPSELLAFLEDHPVWPGLD